MLRWIKDFSQDVRMAARGLAKAPGFLMVAVTALALGIAGSTIVFGTLNKLALAPLPYPESDRLYHAWRWKDGWSASDFSPFSA